MASSADVHVRICGQEIVKYDLEIKALVQVTLDFILSYQPGFCCQVRPTKTNCKYKDVAI